MYRQMLLLGVKINKLISQINFIGSFKKELLLVQFPFFQAPSIRLAESQRITGTLLLFLLHIKVCGKRNTYSQSERNQKVTIKRFLVWKFHHKNLIAIATHLTSSSVTVTYTLHARMATQTFVVHDCTVQEESQIRIYF